jgi:hypothetical protein
MKKKTENKLGLLTAEDLKKEIEITHKELASSLFYQIIDKCGAKKSLALIGRACGGISGSKVIFPSSMFAVREDEENIETMIIIRYVLENWKKLSGEALKYWKKVVMPRMEANRISSAKQECPYDEKTKAQCTPLRAKTCFYKRKCKEMDGKSE